MIENDQRVYYWSSVDVYVAKGYIALAVQYRAWEPSSLRTTRNALDLVQGTVPLLRSSDCTVSELQGAPAAEGISLAATRADCLRGTLESVVTQARLALEEVVIFASSVGDASVGSMFSVERDCSDEVFISPPSPELGRPCAEVPSIRTACNLLDVFAFVESPTCSARPVGL
jgi:hypothetical protein